MKIAVRITNWIGDVVMNMPALEVLRYNYPEAEIVVIARPHVCDLLEFRSDLVNRVIELDDRKQSGGAIQLYRFGKALRSEGFDMGVVLTSHFKGAVLMFYAGIPIRLGFSTWDTALFLNRSIARTSLPRNNRHQSENYLDLLEQAANLIAPRRDPPRLHPNDALNARVQDNYLSERQGPLLVVHPGASYGTAKRWLPDRYATVCRNFLKREKGTVVLLGVAAEAAVNTEIASLVDHPNLVNLCNRTPLRDSIALISMADGFLSGDSGLMHVAAAFNVPQVAVFGPTDPSFTFPNSPRANVLHQPVHCSPCRHRHCPIDHACMKAVEVEEVSESLSRQVTLHRLPN